MCFLSLFHEFRHLFSVKRSSVWQRNELWGNCNHSFYHYETMHKDDQLHLSLRLYQKSEHYPAQIIILPMQCWVGVTLKSELIKMVQKAENNCKKLPIQMGQAINPAEASITPNNHFPNGLPQHWPAIFSAGTLIWLDFRMLVVALISNRTYFLEQVCAPFSISSFF